MRTDGSGQHLLLRNAGAASWSPGGTTIAFIRTGDPWIAARDGSHGRRVLHLPAAALSVEWSPDGRRLVTAPIDRGDLMVVRTDGSESQPLTHAGGYFH